MIEEVYPNIYRIEVPLANLSLTCLNSYVIKGSNENLIIDTGLNSEECFKALMQGLDKLQINLANTSFFLTHRHSDHSGLTPTLHNKGSAIYASSQTAEIMNLGVDWEKLFYLSRMSGLSEKDLKETRDNHPGYQYRPQGTIDFHLVQDQDKIYIGNFTFICLHTPGHSTGHMCLYEPNHKLLIAGDLILQEITPNISQWSQDKNPLLEYLQSLDKISSLDINLVLPGHRSLFKDCHSRIKEIKKHHQHRLSELYTILGNHQLQAIQIASQMSWDIDYRNWDELAFTHKWFTTGEALAHLTYLEEKGLIEREIKDGCYVYKKLE